MISASGWGSVEPDLLSPADWDALAAFPRLCPQFHLALQSGCDATLRRMNRHYTARQYLETVEGIRRRFSNPSVTTDLIAGFPGETEAEFEECCRTVEAAGLLRGHVFEYSPRAGTAAAALPDQVPPAVKKERAKALVRLCRESGRAFAQTQVGRTARVLLEATGGGYTDNYLYVQVFPPGQVPHGAGGWIDVRLDRVVEGGCHGIPINTDCKTEKENEDGGISCFLRKSAPTRWEADGVLADLRSALGLESLTGLRSSSATMPSGFPLRTSPRPG